MADDRKKVSQEQLNILLDALEQDPILLSARGGDLNTKLLYIQKWEKLAVKLNSVDNGALKNVLKWQQTWRDLKSNTRKKASKMSKDTNDLNALYSISAVLNSLEERVMSLCAIESRDSKQESIDISNIVEIDPLSEDSRDAVKHMFANHNKVKTDNHLPNRKRPLENDEDEIKKRRLSRESGDVISQTDIICRLLDLEKSRQASEIRNTEMLKKLTFFLEKQGQVMNTCTLVMRKLTMQLKRLEEREK